MNANQQYHEENNRKAKAQVMNTLKEAEQRKKMLLNPMQPRLNGHQKGVVMFYTNPQKNCDCNDKVLIYNAPKGIFAMAKRLDNFLTA